MDLSVCVCVCATYKVYTDRSLSYSILLSSVFLLRSSFFLFFYFSALAQDDDTPVAGKGAWKRERCGWQCKRRGGEA